MTDARTKLAAFAPAFVEVIEELEMQISALTKLVESRASLTVSLAHGHALVEHVERIEALEAERSALAHNQSTHVERLRRLEESLVWSAERERQARWHETYNAALDFVEDPAVPDGQLGNVGRYEHLLNERVEFAHRKAVKQANRAHGPLEVKALDIDELRAQQIAALPRVQPGPEWRQPHGDEQREALTFEEMLKRSQLLCSKEPSE